MFKGTRKALERAPQWITGHHAPDPEIKIWSKDLAAAKVALNSLDGTVKYQEMSEAQFFTTFLDILEDFVMVRNSDAEATAGYIPESMKQFESLQKVSLELKATTHSHVIQMSTDIDSIRAVVVNLEHLVHKTDRKKIDCEAIVHKHQLDYNDPAMADVPEVKTYLAFYDHTKSLVPKFLKELDIALSGLVQRQLGQQQHFYKTVQNAMTGIIADVQLPVHPDKYTVLSSWTTELEPVVRKLGETQLLRGVAMLPMPVSTWDKLKHAPQTVYEKTPSIQQTRHFASNVGNTVHHGMGYIFPVDAKFFNPHKGIFGEKEEFELKLAEEGKEVEVNGTSDAKDEPPAAKEEPAAAVNEGETYSEDAKVEQKVSRKEVSVHSEPESVPLAADATEAVPVTAIATAVPAVEPMNVDPLAPNAEEPAVTTKASTVKPVSAVEPTILDTSSTKAAEPATPSHTSRPRSERTSQSHPTLESDADLAPEYLGPASPIPNKSALADSATSAPLTDHSSSETNAVPAVLKEPEPIGHPAELLEKVEKQATNTSDELL